MLTLNMCEHVIVQHQVVHNLKITHDLYISGIILPPLGKEIQFLSQIRHKLYPLSSVDAHRWSL